MEAQSVDHLWLDRPFDVTPSWPVILQALWTLFSHNSSRCRVPVPCASAVCQSARRVQADGPCPAASVRESKTDGVCRLAGDFWAGDWYMAEVAPPPADATLCRGTERQAQASHSDHTPRCVHTYYLLTLTDLLPTNPQAATLQPCPGGTGGWRIRRASTLCVCFTKNCLAQQSRPQGSPKTAPKCTSQYGGPSQRPDLDLARDFVRKRVVLQSLSCSNTHHI